MINNNLLMKNQKDEAQVVGKTLTKIYLFSWAPNVWQVKSLVYQDSNKYIHCCNMKIVMLNLFNHVLALFRAKFACILAFRYPVFMWELCKGCV